MAKKQGLHEYDGCMKQGIGCPFPALEADLAAADREEEPAAEVVGRVGVAPVRRVRLRHRRLPRGQRRRRPAAPVHLLILTAAAEGGQDLAVRAVAILHFRGMHILRLLCR